MAIGTTAAILGSAVIGAGASAIAGSKNSKAINQATAAQTDSNAQSLALQERVFNQNRDTLNPFVQRGNTAGNAMNALLGLGGSSFEQGGPQAAQIPGVQPNALAQFQAARGGPSAQQAFGLGYSPTYSYQDGGFEQRPPFEVADAPFTASSPLAAGIQPSINNQTTFAPTTAAPQGQTPQQAAESAFDIFRGSTGYQFRLGEGMDAVNSAYAGSGMFQSGAALRGINEYGQNFASNEFNNYMALLSGQQGTGLQAAGAQAGVGVDYANAASNINQNNANAIRDGAVARAYNNNATFGGISNALGGAFGSLAYAPQRAPTPGFDGTLR